MMKNQLRALFLLLFLSQFLVAQIPPSARIDYDTAELNTTLTVDAPGVLVNDTDVDGDVLTVTEFTVNGSSFLAGETAFLGQGSITISADGGYTFIPNAGFTGGVSQIVYTISDGTFTSFSYLDLTVQNIDNLLEITSLSSCNQGFTVSGEYKVRYSVNIQNNSSAKDTHTNCLVKNIDLINDLQATFGNTCITSVDEYSVSSNNNFRVYDYVNNSSYPLEFDSSAINSNFLNANSTSIFNTSAINDLTLYPGQSVNVSFCVNIKPDCNGRPNQTPSGSGIDFNNTISVTSDRGADTASLLLTDFHTTEAVVTAGLYIPEFYTPRFVNDDPPGVINSDGTYDYSNTVIITNEGTSTANNVNYNMGLGGFFANGISFNEIIVSKVSGGASVSINNLFDGDTETSLLMSGSSLAAGEKVVLEIFYLIAPINSSGYSTFYQISNSQTQGSLDGFDETTAENKKQFSFVTWSDGLGDHLDRYYDASSPTESVSSELQCTCTTSSMRFIFTSESSTNKEITGEIDALNGILEQKEITFQITVKNTSEAVELVNLELTDNLESICGGNIVSVSVPIIKSSTATTNPTLNVNYDGVSDVNIFDGSSGLLKKDETIIIEYSVVFYKTCIGVNSASFTGTDPLGNSALSSSSEDIDASTDTDNDRVTNSNDIDDDNDTIPDILEYNGLNPLADDDSDFIPNYRDTDFSVDANGDGIVDVFDFDSDGVPNHFDLDSDNDGILDIVEAGNISKDTNRSGRTNNSVSSNGFDRTINGIIIPNTDLNGNPDFIDIDADGDGIVDNIEAQATDNYITINNIFSESGIDTAYPNGITPVDTEGDSDFDYVDTNSDNDIRDDIIEGWDVNSDGFAETVASNSDADNDGLDDAFDANDNVVNPTNGQVPTDFPNFDNVDNPERDWREILAIVIIIEPVTRTEGEDFVFNISLVTKNDNAVLIESASDIIIIFSTSNGTDTTDVYDVATAPFDYNAVTNTTLTIPALTTTNQFTVTSLEDNIYEIDDELFTLNGTVTSNNTINNDPKSIGTIIDNDVPPSISMNDSRENEGVNLEHTITIIHPCSRPIIIDVNTSDDLAISPDDYAAISETLTIGGTVDPNNANTDISFKIATKTDNLNELELERLSVTGVVTTTNTGAKDLIKTGTIIDIDPDPFVFIESSKTVEGGSLLFTIKLLNASLELMQNYLPITFTLETLNDTANANEDYQPITISTEIEAYSSSITQSVNTIDDKLNEETEEMLLQAVIINGTVSNTFPASGVGFIKDDDYPNLFSPNGDGKSDLFKISGIEDTPDFKLIIYDRWGNEVYNYSNNGRSNPVWWNGNRNGKPVPAGVYFYTLDFNDGITEPVRNFVELLR